MLKINDKFQSLNRDRGLSNCDGVGSGLERDKVSIPQSG